MDAGALGAVIGIGVMVGVCVCIKIHDIMTKKKKEPTVKTPLLAVQPPVVVFKPKKHWKVNDLLPKSKKTILLKNLNSMTPSRNLTETINQATQEWKLTTAQSV